MASAAPSSSVPSFDEILRDLCCRFLVTATNEDYQKTRILWQIEQAHWCYLDYWTQIYPSLKAYKLPEFAKKVFQHYPPLIEFLPELDSLMDHFKRYKRSIPVCGGIILNPQMNRILLVRGLKKTDCFSFPRGKINREESEIQCAVREVKEETGVDVSHLLKPDDKITLDLRNKGGQHVTLYFATIPEDGNFHPVVINEIGAIQWFSIDKLIQEDSRAYLVPNFLPKIRQWVVKNCPDYTPAASHGKVVFDLQNPDAILQEQKPTELPSLKSFYLDKSKMISCLP